MVGAADIVAAVVVKAAGTYYEFIDGWKCILDGFENGMAKISRQSDEFEETKLHFIVPVDQLELIHE